jgi:16S rRNA (guanine527-N7)-methyltransferase
VPAVLPELDHRIFATRLAELAPQPLPAPCVAALYAHYVELRLWNRRVSLIGPGTAEEVLTRHYGESMAALPLIPRAARRLVDLGSGAGFPGFVLAAARPDLEVTLVEARQRKWAFLEAAARKSSLPLTCLNAKVGTQLPADLPETFDILTLRALKLPTRVLQAVTTRLGPDGQVLVWAGDESPVRVPGFSVFGRVHLAGSRRRQILDLRRRADL